MPKTGFENLKIYQLAVSLSDLIWRSANRWGHFEKDTVGKQVVRAADSIGANIAEGSGRGSVADNRRFARIARGSLYEVKHWIGVAERRRLLSDTDSRKLQSIVAELLPKLGAYIKSLDNSLK